MSTTAPTLTPDQRVRVFISSTLKELEAERRAAREAVESIRMIPVMFELGARPHPPRDLYRSYLAQSHVFLGIYWERYGWIAPGETISGLEDEYRLAAEMPKLIYIKEPAAREERLRGLLDAIRSDDSVSYKGFSTPDELRELVQDDLALMLTERFAAPARAVPAPAGREDDVFPVQPTPFVGRAGEVEALRNLLTAEDNRLVTLTGPGGIGKSRLAFEAARPLRDVFSGGMTPVLLGPLGDASLVVPAIARALGVRESAGRSTLEAVAEHVADSRRLLILDNFEHVLPAGQAVRDLLLGCSGLTVLTTSRAALGLAGERVFRVEPLSLPALAHVRTVDDARGCDAVALFVDRARVANPGFELTDENVAQVVEVVDRLDGLPLSIELAAARARLLSPQGLLDRLGDRFRLLSRGPRDLPERQQTLRGLLDWDYELLTEEERATWRRTSIFAGGFTLDAAEKVVSDNGGEFELLDSLDSLIRKSLLLRENVPGTEPRFTMLNTLREYASEKLDESGELDHIARRHAQYYLDLAERAEARLRKEDQAHWLDVLEHEHDNMRAVLRTATHTADATLELRLASRLARFWEYHAHLTEGQRWLEEALSRATDVDPALRADGLDGAAILALAQGELKRATALMEESVEIRRSLGDPSRLGSSLRYLAIIKLDRGDTAGARDLLQQSLALQREAGNEGELATVLSNVGIVAIHDEEWDYAAELYQQSLELFARTGDTLGMARAMLNLSDVRLHSRDLDEARDLLEQSLKMFEQLGMWWDIAYVIENLGGVAAYAGRPEDAARLIGAADRGREELGTPLPEGEKVAYNRYLAAAKDALGDDAFAAAWEEGRSMSLREAADLGLNR
ncbi:MAG TPA: tetratricopeptide repeat protein [Actinomycetota bacterium]|nr:tetratricopeptide repeat protein [Actinomycetota bacterium]